MAWRTLLALLLAALALTGAALALRGGNARVARRYLQWWSPPLTLLYAWLAFELADRLPPVDEIVAWLATLPRLPEFADGAVLAALQTLVTVAADQVPLLLIVLYLPVKWLGFALHRLLRRWSLPASWFYLLDEGGRSAVLRPEWSYSRMLLSGAAWVALALLLYPVAQLSGWGEVSPLWPALAFVILAESAWFLRGVPWTPDTEAAGAGRGGAEIDLDAIVRESRALFGRWLLGAQRVRIGAQPAPDRDPSRPCADLDLDGWSDACCLLLDDLLTGESVVVEGALPQQVEPCLGYYLRDRVLRGGRLLVLVPHLADVTSARAWIGRLLRQPGWPVVDWEEALSTRPVAVVATLHHDLYRLLDERWGPDLDTLVLPDAHGGAAWFAAEIHALIGAIMDRAPGARAPQVIAFADWRVDNQSVLRNLFGVIGKNRKLGKGEVDAEALLWRSDGVDEGGRGFQGRLFSAINAHVTPEVALAYPAAREGARPQLVGQGGRPVDEALDEAAGAADAGQIDAAYAGPVRLEGRALPYRDDWSPPFEAERPPVVIAYDRLFNLPATLRRWLPAGVGRSLVEVVSPPYLYRELFAGRLQLEVAQPRRFTALGPGPLSAEWAAAFTLYRRLERGWVDQERIRLTLRDAGLDAAALADVPAALAELFERHLALPGARFEARSERRFDPDASPARFVARSELRLGTADAGASPRRPAWLDAVDVVGRERERGEPRVLARVHRGHLYQRFLEGQTHLFGGQPYRIERIDEGGVRARWVGGAELRLYRRQIRRVTLDLAGAHTVAEHAPEVAAERTRLRLARLRLPLTVHTDGDYRWLPHDGLDLAAAEVHRSTAVPSRSDPHGKLLHLRLTPPAGASGDSAAIEVALAALLGEALPSYHPEAHPFVMVAPVRSPPRPDGGGPDARELIPALEGAEGLGEGVVIVEDSPFDLGVLASLWDKLDDVLGDVAEYLAWRAEVGWDEQPFGPFGAGATLVQPVAEELLAWLRALPAAR